MSDEGGGGGGGAPGWMVTFADLMSLLLTFFVLLLSFSNMEIVKFRVMSGAVKNALGLRSEIDLSEVPTGSDILPNKNPREGDGESPKKNDLKDPSTARQTVVRLRKILEELEIQDQAEVVLRADGAALRVDGDLFFDSGKSQLKPGARKILDTVWSLAMSEPGRLDVEGHTDSVPIATSIFPSNWELSAARAGSAVRYLVGRGLPAPRVRAVGYADTQPVESNDSASGRAANRRVEFFFKSVGPAEVAAVAPDPAGETS